MTTGGVADKSAAITLLTGSPAQAAEVLRSLPERIGDADLARRIAGDPRTARAKAAVSLLKNILRDGGEDRDSASLLLQAAAHIGDQEALEWGSRLMLRLEPDHAQAHCHLAKAAHARGDEAGRERHFAALIDVLREAATARKVDLALNLETLIYNGVVKLVDEENFVHAKLARIIPIMDELGSHVRSLLPEPPAPQGRFDPPRIAFVFPSGALLAHSKVLLSICQALQATAGAKITPVVYVVGPWQADFVDAFRACGVPVKVLSGEKGPSNSVVVNRLVALRQALATDGIRLATWVSAPAGGAFYAAGRFARQQAYWSMKFHGLIAPGIDHYVSCASCWETEKTVHGQDWQCGPVSFNDALAGGEPSQVAEIRERFGKGAILLGVLAREEKIFSQPYLKAVAKILEGCPPAVFLWSGRSEHPGIRRFFADRGLNGRTPWIGWVNTATYAPALDVFLETFPFGCGMTSAQALAAGVPVVSFKDWSSVFGHHLEPLLSGRAGSEEDRAKVRALFTGTSGEDCFTMVPDAAAYVAMARRLIEDLGFRREVGAAGQRFYRDYLGNSAFSAERFARIFQALAPDELQRCA